MKEIIKVALIGICFACIITVGLGIIVITAVSLTERTLMSPWHLFWFVPVGGGVTGALIGVVGKLMDTLD